MGEPKQTIIQELVQGIEKAFVWLIYITVGVVAKLAFDSRSNQLTRRQIIVKSVLSIFAGYMSAVACEYFGYEKLGKLIVPVATLLGESIIVYLMTNWRKIADNILPAWFKTKK